MAYKDGRIFIVEINGHARFRLPIEEARPIATLHWRRGKEVVLIHEASGRRNTWCPDQEDYELAPPSRSAATHEPVAQ